MAKIQRRKGLMVILGIFVLFIGFAAIELLIVKFNGSPVAVPRNIPRSETFGSGEPVTYVVLGDSTAVAQGGSYETGIAVESAKLIAGKNHRVTLKNHGVSGARVHDVLEKQLSEISYTPDIVLLSMSANDVTHGTSVQSVKNDTSQIISDLRQKNPAVQIFITGTPAMGSIPRFPQPLRWAAGKRTEQMNRMFVQLAADQRITNIEIAQKLGPRFAKNPQLFAPDKFHPNNKGYAEWNKVIATSFEHVLLP